MAQTIAKEIANHSNRVELIRWKPPRIALILLAVDVGLHLAFGTLLPWKFGCVFCGLGLIAFGFALIWAWWLFRRQETAICTTATATVLVVGGPFRVSRNPMYVGITAMLLGCAWILGTVPALFAPIAFFVLMNALFIPFEEQRLSEIFGLQYAEYRRWVLRWV